MALKDLSKLGIKKAMDLIEREAYVDFFLKDLVARSTYPLFRLTSAYYWEAYGAWEQLLGAKTKVLLQGFDESGLKRKTSTTFARDATLEISLTLEAPRGETPPALEVYVGGRRATLTVVGSHRYKVDVAYADLADDGTVRLEIR
jgi:hypothetical protein